MKIISLEDITTELLQLSEEEDYLIKDINKLNMTLTKAKRRLLAIEKRIANLLEELEIYNKEKKSHG